MKRLATAVLATTALALVAAGPAAAKPVAYAGKTSEGTKITFKLAGGKIKQLKTFVPVTCVPSTAGDTTQAGMDSYNAPGSYPLGKETQREALQESGMHYNKVTKVYTVIKPRRKRNGTVVGKLRMSFSKSVLATDAFGNFRLAIYICQGTARFNVGLK
jgi:hypothetical protein